MSELVQMKCTAYRGDEPTLTDAEIEELKPQVPEWQVVERDRAKQLERSFGFGNFAQALEFTNRVGKQAEEEGHHPALLTEWGRVTVHMVDAQDRWAAPERLRHGGEDGRALRGLNEDDAEDPRR
jgi:4a-hydroxytetrahydrobiopterin dehydratase